MQICLTLSANELPSIRIPFGCSWGGSTASLLLPPPPMTLTKPLLASCFFHSPSGLEVPTGSSAFSLFPPGAQIDRQLPTVVASPMADSLLNHSWPSFSRRWMKRWSFKRGKDPQGRTWSCRCWGRQPDGPACTSSLEACSQ